MSSSPSRKYALLRAQVLAETLVELGCIGLHPTIHGRVVDCYAAIDQHALPVTVVDRELQIPTLRPIMNSAVNRRP